MCVASGPDDCYEGDGESYRGFVSETVSDLECLPWNSHLLPYSEFDEDDGTGPHNYCRSEVHACGTVIKVRLW